MKDIWSPRYSIRLSRVITIAFAIALLVIDLCGVPFTDFMVKALFSHNNGLAGGYLLLLNLYLCSIPGYILLYSLYQLLKNIEGKAVFIPQNVVYLRRVSWCCVAAALFCGITAFVWPSHGVIALAAAFMALIVRVVKNVFAQAILMQDELDFTV